MARMMPRTQAVKIPLDHLAPPVDITIRIFRDGAHYRAYISAVGQDQQVPISMSQHDLMILNKQLQDEIQSIAAEGIQEEPTKAEVKDQLLYLAEAGHYAFKQVFGYRDALAIMQQLLTLDPRASIQIIAEDFFLPWELMYPVSIKADEPLSYQHFWGVCHVISRVIAQSARPGAFVSPAIPIAHRPRLGLLAYAGLPNVVQREIPFFERLHTDGEITLIRLRRLDPERWREEYAAFRGFFGEALNLAHFACHVSYREESPNLSRILLSDDFPITLKDLEVYGVEISDHPLVILNACETGNLNPLYTANFAAAFLKYGARGVVATECAVPDDFAGDFAQELYTHLLAGEPLGESLLATRRYFLEEHNNPSGLLYSMYAPPSIRLVREGE